MKYVQFSVLCDQGFSAKWLNKARPRNDISGTTAISSSLTHWPEHTIASIGGHLEHIEWRLIGDRFKVDGEAGREQAQRYNIAGLVTYNPFRAAKRYHSGWSAFSDTVAFQSRFRLFSLYWYYDNIIPGFTILSFISLQFL